MDLIHPIKSNHWLFLKIFGRNLFWYAIVFGTIAAISRKVVADELQVIDPEWTMCLVVQQTHYMPKRWRGKESSELVRREFETLFQVISSEMLQFYKETEFTQIVFWMSHFTNEQRYIFFCMLCHLALEYDYLNPFFSIHHVIFHHPPN
jgi:hypothetical protein